MTTTSDSMTSVTHMTISSSELSFNLDEVSVKSISSTESYDTQWQLLWAEHCSHQYQLEYLNFKAIEENTISEDSVDPPVTAPSSRSRNKPRRKRQKYLTRYLELVFRIVPVLCHKNKTCFLCPF